MPNNAQRQRDELEDLRMLGELYSHEGEWLLEDRGDHESWARKREKERNGDSRENSREGERESEREEKTSLTGYLYMHLWGPILASNILS